MAFYNVIKLTYLLRVIPGWVLAIKLLMVRPSDGIASHAFDDVKLVHMTNITIHQ